jgi:protocatechuate 3,4-dioxygenase beta subunit
MKFTQFFHAFLKTYRYDESYACLLKESFMDKDDKPVGQILNRRDALKLLGIGSAAFLASCATPNATSTSAPASNPTVGMGSTQAESTAATVLDCVVRPELTIGPYFVDGQLNRSDIRSDPSDNSVVDGVPLTLNISVSSVGNNSCISLEDAQVDIWHCDGQGRYSGASDSGFDNSGQQFLRGYQLTDANGVVQFQTIYPGWYSGRAVHIHFTIRTKGASAEDYQFTSQFFFDDTLSDQVHALEPYVSKGQRDTRNATDNIFLGGGDQLLLNLQGDAANGFTGGMSIGLDLTDMEVGATDSAGGPSGPGGGPPP